MEIILSKQCEAITGSLGRGFGYSIQRRTGLNGKTRFWGVRKSKGAIPPDGHLEFIVLCAELAQAKLHISDIRVSRKELVKAVEEAGWCISRFMENLHPTLSAKEVLIFKEKVGL